MDKWSNYFMDVAKRTSELSKDPHTKVGAVLVKDKKIKSIGYNGAPNTFDDDCVPTTNNAPEMINQKNSYMIHAELNAVLNYDGKIEDLAGSTLYTTISPCHNCALLLAQIGIKRVVYLEKYHRNNMTEISDRIFSKCHIDCEEFNEN